MLNITTKGIGFCPARRPGLQILIAIIMIGGYLASASAQTPPLLCRPVDPSPAQTQSRPAPPGPADSLAEIRRLQTEVDQLRAEVDRLRALVVTKVTLPANPIPQPATAEGKGLQTAKSEADSTMAQAARIAPKSKGGDLAGAGRLVHTDRITIGGYGDFQFRQSSISERADGGGTPTFQSTRLVMGLAAVLSEKQNIVFNSEIEYEFGARELDVEQAFIEWKARPEIALRGGIIVPAIGRFNTYHDSNLNLTTIRPLINQFIIPTAYRDAGIGLRGRLRLPHKMKLSYEADVVNGMRGADADGQATPFSRLLGQSSAAEPGLVAFQAETHRKALVGRLALSPLKGLELGVSAYNGRFKRAGDPLRSVTILFVDASYHRGALTIDGEYGRSNIVGGGILRKSPAPPTAVTGDPEALAVLARFVAETSPGQDGFYLEGSYSFAPRVFLERLDEGAYIAPVVRYEVVRLDRTIPNFYLNRSRTTIGVNIAPSPTVILKLDYLFNHTFGPAPVSEASVGGPLPGVNPLPHAGYGKNGFTGSVAYVF